MMRFSLYVCCILISVVAFSEAHAQFTGIPPFSGASANNVSFDFSNTGQFTLTDNRFQGSGVLTSAGGPSGSYNYSIYKCVPTATKTVDQIDRVGLLENIDDIFGIYWGYEQHIL